jgi:hypothetical protein
MRIRVVHHVGICDQGSQKNIHPTRTGAGRPVPVALECKTRAKIS